MTQRTKAIEVLSVYFEKQGRILTPREYRERTDTPIRFARIKSIFGGWNRMENIVRTFNGRNQKSEDYVPATDVDKVIRAAAEKEAAYAETMRAASENVDAKTAREEAARAHLEADKLRAATAEGALENKLRKGGLTDQDAKAKAEAIEHAVAEEHALLAMTAEGAALGKHLLGGVEDNDEKTIVIEEQNAQREKTALLAGTALGAAEAKLMEDDTDGQLTREAQARIRNELRTYVPPVTEASAEETKANAMRLVRDEVREVVEKAFGDENVSTGSATKASEARQELRIDNTVELSDELAKTMPPADQPADPAFIAESQKEIEAKLDANSDKSAAPALKAPSNTAPLEAKKPVVDVKKPNATPAKPATKEAAKDN